MKKINQIALVASKALEILHWVGTASMVLLLAGSIFANHWLSAILNKGAADLEGTLSTYGWEILAVHADGTVNMTAVTLFSIGAVFILALMAMVFRNVFLIIKTAQGKTWFAVSNTPFQKDIVRMLREIGIFYLMIPLIALTMSVISRLVLGIETAELSVRLEGIITGILILCLSQVFVYGTALQQDVDGLI